VRTHWNQDERPVTGHEAFKPHAKRWMVIVVVCIQAHAHAQRSALIASAAALVPQQSERTARCLRDIRRVRASAAAAAAAAGGGS
jgi:hypothetical protein